MRMFRRLNKLKAGLLFTLFCGTWFSLGAQIQFKTELLTVQLGYNLHNTYSSRFNYLIESYNLDRYPAVISEKMGEINFLHGYLFGLNYQLTDKARINLVFKNRHQNLKALYSEEEYYRKYLFRSLTLEVGASYQIHGENWFRHFAGGGVVIGSLSAFTNWTKDKKSTSGAKMLNIDHSFVLGISVHYEAQFRIFKYMHLFLRPVIQYAIPSHLDKLNAFLNPTFEDDAIKYYAKEDDKYNKGTFNGFGLEGGLLILLPELIK